MASNCSIIKVKPILYEIYNKSGYDAHDGMTPKAKCPHCHISTNVNVKTTTFLMELSTFQFSKIKKQKRYPRMILYN